MYILRFVNKKCFMVVNSHKRFKKCLNFINEFCEYKVWNDCVRENISSLCFSFRFKLRAADMAFLLYLRHEMFNMLNRLSLKVVSATFLLVCFLS